ncbi:response regulator transcription factor [Enterocloster lavalensis]|uniref:response regulator transcription factor n=1 Tax=Enterocloster lavalensis TaxID=460384 RepID=UPI0023F33208|nr:response regulator [Enterocloster lavalensis]
MYQVYIVDDAVLTRKALVMTMPWDRWGCVVVGSADDGERAFEEIVKLEPDIVITDIRMVHVSGLELIRRCRAEGIRAQFIIISGYNEFEYAKAALRMEVLDYILKPIDDEELQKAVEKAVQRIGETKALSAERREQEGEIKSLLLEYDEKNMNAYLRGALRYVRENYARELSIRDVAAHLAISDSYLAKLFKVELNITFLEYLTRVRMRRAMELMRDKNMPIYEVAERVGYRDYRHFSSTFKKLAGVGPKEFQMRS